MNDKASLFYKAMKSRVNARHGLRAFFGWLASGIDLLFPISCVGCGRGTAIWCAACDRDLHRFSPPLCERCGTPLRTARICASCTSRPLPLDVRSYARYRTSLMKALVALKYRPNRRLAAVMAAWLEASFYQAGWEASLVVPVPLSQRRRNRRGYNQAELLADEFARRLHLPLEHRSLQRIRDTRTQVGLVPDERWRNVQGAFRATGSVLAGQVVVLIDDLYTTGATLSACAQALQEAGVERVHGLTVARA